MQNSDKQTTYRFIFSAQISKFSMKAKISSPMFVTWKRSQETAKSDQYDMVQGQVDFSIKNQILNLPVNMYYDHNTQSFQQKKSVFNFTMITPKGQKVAGVVYVDLAKMLNNKMEQLADTFVLQKCPVKQSTVQMKITSECKGEKSGDTQSQASTIEQNQSLSMISINKSAIMDKPQQSQAETEKTKKQKSVSNNVNSEQVKSLQQKISLLTKINKRLQKQLQQSKKVSDDNSLKQQLMKSKSIQNKLEEQITELRKQNMQHQKQLQKVRAKLEHVYQNIYSSLSQHFI